MAVSGVATVEFRRFKHGQLAHTVRVLVRNADDVRDAISKAASVAIELSPTHIVNAHIAVVDWIAIDFDVVA